MYIETPLRSVVKTVSWRLTATVTTIVLVYLFTGEIKTALAVGSIEVFAKLIIFYWHERGWAKIKFGKRDVNPFVIWCTGLSGSKKGELSKAICEELKKRDLKVEYINGENIRNIASAVGFDKKSRIDHIKRVGFFASRFEERGIFVVASFVSPDLEARNFVRKMCKNFFEVYVSTPLEICKKNDKKGIYLGAREGRFQNVAGVDYPYETSENPELSVDLSQTSVPDAVNRIVKKIEKEI